MAYTAYKCPIPAAQVLNIEKSALKILQRISQASMEVTKNEVDYQRDSEA